MEYILNPHFHVSCLLAGSPPLGPEVWLRLSYCYLGLGHTVTGAQLGTGIMETLTTGIPKK